MSTFTEFCAVKDGVAYCGSKSDIVHRVCEYIRMDLHGQNLRFKVRGYEEDSRLSFSNEFSRIEKQVEASLYIWGRLEKEYGFTIYHRTL